VLSAALAGLLVIGGCSKDNQGGTKTGDKKESKTAEKKEGKTGGDQKGGGGAVAAAGVGEVAGKGTGTLKGKVTFVGAMPEIKSQKAQIEMQADKERCLMGDTNEQTWKIGPDKSVQYVVVWLRPINQDKGAYFKLTDEQKKRTKPVNIDQPYCQFEPHVTAVFPDYFDGKTQKATGEKFEIHNSAPMNHNTAWSGNDLFNKGDNKIIPPKGKLDVDAKPGRRNKPGEDLVHIHCDLHKWMSAYAWVFDHPYYAVTDKNGNYEIKGVPTGVELEVVHWHETSDKPKAEKMTLKDGDNTKNFELKK
jgi:hypothetical protein